MALDKVFANGELTNKVLKCLDKQWQPKVTAIVESKDLDTMSLATLFGKLQEHEMELGRLTLHEESDKNKKSISFKATTTSAKSQDKSCDDDESDLSNEDEETMNLLVSKFSKFLRRKGGFKKFQKRDIRGTRDSKETFRKSKSSNDKIICHECGKVGHIKFQCPTYLKRIESEKKDSRDIKSKRAYIVWDVPEDQSTSTSTSDDEESAKLCLMTKDHNSDEESSESDKSDPSNVSDSESENSPTYEMLYSAYVELHEELKKLAKINVERKRIILLHEQKIIEMQKELDELKLENETLDLIYANSLCNCSSKMTMKTNCENCMFLEEENHMLKERIANFTKCSHELDNMLSSQRAIGNRTGLGYVKNRKKSYKKHVDFSNVSYAKSPTCFYCGVFGHTSNKCHIRLKGVPNGNYIWIVKGKDPYATNHQGPKTTWVPKTCF